MVWCSAYRNVHFFSLRHVHHYIFGTTYMHFIEQVDECCTSESSKAHSFAHNYTHLYTQYIQALFIHCHRNGPYSVVLCFIVRYFDNSPFILYNVFFYITLYSPLFSIVGGLSMLLKKYMELLNRPFDGKFYNVKLFVKRYILNICVHQRIYLYEYKHYTNKTTIC